MIGRSVFSLHMASEDLKYGSPFMLISYDLFIVLIHFHNMEKSGQDILQKCIVCAKKRKKEIHTDFEIS